MSSRPRQVSDLSKYGQVPQIDALEELRGTTRRPALRDYWTPKRTLLVALLAPIAFWAYSSYMDGRATSGPMWIVLTALLSVGAAFVASTYLDKKALAGGVCSISPLVGLFLAGWFVQINPTLIGVFLAAVIVTAGAVQRVNRPSC